MTKSTLREINTPKETGDGVCLDLPLTSRFPGPHRAEVARSATPRGGGLVADHQRKAVLRLRGKAE